MPHPLFAGAQHIALDSVDSTNNYAKNLLASQKVPEGSFITATEQTAGRGQAESRWHTEPGQNLTASYILYPSFLPVDKQFFLSMAVSLAVRELCEEVINDDVRIKWPNDIYHNGRKLAGILIENTISGSQLSSSVVGIGLNVNQVDFDPALPNPASLRTITGQVQDLKAITEKLGHYLEKYYLQLRNLHYNFLDKAYTVHLYRYNQTSLFKKDGQEFRGEIMGVTKEGKLIIESAGKQWKFGLKEVEYL